MSSSEKRCRCVFIVITITVCIILALHYFVYAGEVETSKSEIPKAYFLQADNFNNETCIPVCDSRSCIMQAYNILKSIKQSIDPCENFQSFLCGSYEEKLSREDGGTVLSDMTNKMLDMLKTLLENIEAEPGSAAAKLKVVYDSCVNLGSSELSGVEYFKQSLNDVEIFNWPHLAPDFKFSDNGLTTLMATFRSYLEVKFIGFVGVSYLGNVYIKVDFNHDIFKNIPIIQKNEVVDILEYFDMEPVDAEIVFNDLEVVRNALLHFAKDGKAYLDECNENCTGVYFDCSISMEDDWAHVCEMVKVYLDVTALKQYFNTNQIIIEKNYVFYVKNLIPRLKLLSDRSIANFFAFNLLWNHLSEINFFFRRKMQKYFKYFASSPNQTSIIADKWKHCLAWITNGNMKFILENELVKSYLTRPYIDEIHDIHQRHTSIINKMINDQKWITSYAKISMKNHIRKLECNMAFNQRLLPNDTYVDELSKAFTPTPASFFLNILRYKRSLLVAFSTLELTHGRKLESKFDASAFTNYLDEIVFHYGFLIPPVYYPGHKKIINLIQLAHIISHEIGHSAFIRLNFISEFYAHAKNVYSLRKQCINNQFSNFKYKVLGEYLNGSRYFEENFSDNLGYAVADKMIDELESSEKTFMLPGLPYSLKQLLYMSSRQAWCSKSSRKMDIISKTIEKHPPSEFRIIASGQNSKGFSKAFSCPDGSYMNPTEKCIIFDSA